MKQIFVLFLCAFGISLNAVTFCTYVIQADEIEIVKSQERYARLTLKNVLEQIPCYVNQQLEGAQPLEDFLYFWKCEALSFQPVPAQSYLINAQDQKVRVEWRQPQYLVEKKQLQAEIFLIDRPSPSLEGVRTLYVEKCRLAPANEPHSDSKAKI